MIGNEARYGGAVTINHSLIQISSDPANPPFFTDPKSISLTPTLQGDYRIEFGFPTVDLGDNSARQGSRDLLNNARIQLGNFFRIAVSKPLPPS